MGQKRHSYGKDHEEARVGLMRIKVSKKKCSGCHLCEMVCSLSHFGAVNTEKSAIRIQKDDLQTSMNVPLVCRQCKEMICLKNEDVNEAEEKEKFIWQDARAEDCPFGAVHVFAGTAFHCDLCGGKPECVTVCTTGAIQVVGKRR